MINIDGSIQQLDAQLSSFNRSFLYGDGVFETLKVAHGKIFFWEDHYFRLMASMRILRMEIPLHFTPEYLEEQIQQTVDAAALKDSSAVVRLTVYRNEGGKYLPETNSVGFCAFAKAHPSPFYTLSEDAYEVDLYKDHYVAEDLLSTIKTTSKALHVTGSIYAKENGLDNCLLLNTNKHVIEALNGNLFVVKGKTIKTAPLADGCLRGIVRKQLITIIKLLKDDYTLEESSVSPFELQKADELFITNAVAGIIPITKYRKKEFTNNTAKRLLQKLNTKARLG